MIKLGVIGAGSIANWHVGFFGKQRGCKVIAVCDLDYERALAFAKKHSIDKAYASLDEMLADNKLDALVNVTNDKAHAPTSLAALKQGLHVFCEKPLATNYKDAHKMELAAKEAGVINMVHFSYRNSSAIQRAHKMIQNGDIGEIVHFDAAYFQSWLTSNDWGDWHTTPSLLWRLSTAHGSMGVLGDLGVHIIDFASFAAGSVKNVQCRLKTFEKIKGRNCSGYRLDANDTAVINAEMKNGAMGTIQTTRWATGHSNTVKLAVFGTKGAIKVNLDNAYDSLAICRGKDIDTFSWKEIKCAKTPSMMERFIKSIKTGINDVPDFARGAEIQKVLDSCVKSAELDKIIKI